VLLPRILRPLPATPAEDSADAPFGEAPIVLLRLPRGGYAAESLAGVIEHAARWPSCVWLRAAENRPGALAGSLTGACLHRWAVADQGPAASPAPIAGLVAVLRSSPRGAAVVVELDGPPTTGVRRLLREIRPVLADRGTTLVVVAEHRRSALWLGRGLRGPPAAGWATAPLPLSAGVPQRLLSLAGRRTAVVRDVTDAAGIWSADAVVAALERARGCRSLLRHLTADLLELCRPAQRAALQVCVRFGYWHPQLGTEAVLATGLRPWVLPLEDHWGWLRPVWRRPLQSLLTGGAGPVIGPAVPGPRLPRRREPAPAVGEPTMDVRLLGPFELRVDGRAVRKWNGHRGAQVMRYLLARRRYACSRDELLEEFWPDVTPEVARNRLQVAVSGLRRALAEVTALPVVEFAGGEYRVSPRFQVVVDVERFERALTEARRAERAGDSDVALARLREAVDLYRGDFVPDAPYGQWTLLPRESLRLAYLDALDRLSRIHIARRDADQCIATALRMLDVDPCWEPAHRILIRCYAQQGRTYLALRQFELCRRLLEQTLGTDPQAETTQLYRAVRTGRFPEPVLTM